MLHVIPYNWSLVPFGRFHPAPPPPTPPPLANTSLSSVSMSSVCSVLFFYSPAVLILEQQACLRHRHCSLCTRDALRYWEICYLNLHFTALDDCFLHEPFLCFLLGRLASLPTKLPLPRQTMGQTCPIRKLAFT